MKVVFLLALLLVLAAVFVAAKTPSPRKHHRDEVAPVAGELNRPTPATRDYPTPPTQDDTPSNIDSNMENTDAGTPLHARVKPSRAEASASLHAPKGGPSRAHAQRPEKRSRPTPASLKDAATPRPHHSKEAPRTEQDELSVPAPVKVNRKSAARNSKKVPAPRRQSFRAPEAINMVGGAEVPNTAEGIAFKQFMLDYNRNYISMDETNYRFGIFSANYASMESHNEEADAGKHTYWMGINRFSDFTQEEYRSFLTASPNGKTVTLEAEPFVYDSSVALPAEVDWRKEGLVVGVKDQGQCGSCWTFSAIGSMEGAHALATKNLISLSEQEIVDCLEDHKGCGGGWMIWAFEYVIKKNGTESEKDYPYLGTDGHACKWNKTRSVATFSTYHNITVGDESALMAAAAVRPGVSVAIDASHPSFSSYKKGVYYEPACSKDVNDLDHAVLVVGYGTLNATDYFLVKNSWGVDWGMDGYILMARNQSNNCGIATAASFIVA